MPKLIKDHYNGKAYRQFLEAIEISKVIKAFLYWH